MPARTAPTSFAAATANSSCSSFASGLTSEHTKTASRPATGVSRRTYDSPSGNRCRTSVPAIAPVSACNCRVSPACPGKAKTTGVIETFAGLRHSPPRRAARYTCGILERDHVLLCREVVEHVGEFPRRLGMDDEQRLPALDNGSDRREEIDPRSRRLRRARELCRACETAIVDLRDATTPGRGERMLVGRLRRLTHAALARADRAEFLQGAAIVENARGERQSGALRDLGGEFEDAPGKAQCARPQVARCAGLAPQNRQHIAGLERRPDAPADWLAAVGDHDADLDPDRLPDLLQL